MYNNKKAISDVVSTVLIILLVVAAIAIIGAIVLNTVGKTSTKVDTAVSCQTLDIKPTSCTKTGTASANVVVTRNSGGSDVTLSSVSVIFQKADGSTVASTTTSSVPAALNTATASTTLDVANIASVKIAAQITGASEICPATQAITCA